MRRSPHLLVAVLSPIRTRCTVWFGLTSTSYTPARDHPGIVTKGIDGRGNCTDFFEP
jgi:hypothetical protein